MPTAKTLPFPPHWINRYLFDKLSEYDSSEVGIALDQTLSPFFTSGPVSREETYQALINTTGLPVPLMVQYERLMRFRTNPFYGIKKEQVLYYIDGTVSNVNNVATIISQLLDREDVAAQEINAWSAENPMTIINPTTLMETIVESNVFFHNVRVYQVDEARDVTELGSANLPGYTQKIIIEYDYHANYTTNDEKTFN